MTKSLKRKVLITILEKEKEKTGRKATVAEIDQRGRESFF